MKVIAISQADQQNLVYTLDDEIETQTKTSVHLFGIILRMWHQNHIDLSVDLIYVYKNYTYLQKYTASSCVYVSMETCIEDWKFRLQDCFYDFRMGLWISCFSLTLYFFYKEHISFCNKNNLGKNGINQQMISSKELFYVVKFFKH